MPQFSCHEFRDFDSFREHLCGWDTEPVQLGAGPLRLQWDALRFDEMGIAHLQVNRRLADVSTVEAGTLAFVVALRPQRWCGLEAPAGSLIVVAPGREHRSCLEADFCSIEITASEALLREVGLDTGRLDPRDFPPERCVVPLDRRLVLGFEGIARVLRDGMGGTGRTWRASALRRHTLGLLGRALRQEVVPGIRRTPRYGLALAALRIAEGSREPPRTVREMATALDVTPRALEYAFDSALAVPPARYLLAQRLNQVRRDLLAAHTLSVTEAASRRGFEHLGRFAEHYRKLFGELPSRTQRLQDRHDADLAEASRVPRPGTAGAGG